MLYLIREEIPLNLKATELRQRFAINQKYCGGLAPFCFLLKH